MRSYSRVPMATRTADWAGPMALSTAGRSTGSSIWCVRSDRGPCSSSLPTFSMVMTLVAMSSANTSLASGCRLRNRPWNVNGPIRFGSIGSKIMVMPR